MKNLLNRARFWKKNGFSSHLNPLELCNHYTMLQQSTGGWSFVTTPETLCWSYLQHLEDHLHQFVVYIKSTHHNFLDSLLQQYNFGISIIEVSEDVTDTDEPEEETTTEPQADADIDADNQSDQHKEQGVQSTTDSSPIEEEEKHEKELEEPSARTSFKSRKKHIIREGEDEPAEEPPISFLSRKGKEKVITPPASNDEAEHIDAELEVAAARVTRTPTETKHMLDIIAAIMAEGYAAEYPAPAPSRQTPNKPILASPKGPSKRKGGTSGGIAAVDTPEPKRTISVSSQPAAPTATPPTSPSQRKKKSLPATSPQESPKDRLASSFSSSSSGKTSDSKHVTDLSRANTVIPKSIQWKDINLPEEWILEGAAPPAIPKQLEPNTELRNVTQYSDGRVKLSFRRSNSTRFSDKESCSSIPTLERKFTKIPSVINLSFQSQPRFSTSDVPSSSIRSVDYTTNILHPIYTSSQHEQKQDEKEPSPPTSPTFSAVSKTSQKLAQESKSDFAKAIREQLDRIEAASSSSSKAQIAPDTPQSSKIGSPPDLTIDNRLSALNQSRYNASSVYEWNIDGMSEYNILGLLQQMTMAANAYKTQSGTSDKAIAEILIAGDPSHLRDKNAELLHNLRCRKLSEFQTYKTTFFTRLFLRDDANHTTWKEKFLAGLPTLLSEKVRNSIKAIYDNRIPHDDLTYGELVSFVNKEGLKVCQDLKLQKRLKWELKKSKQELGGFCKQFNYDPFKTSTSKDCNGECSSRPHRKHYKSKSHKKPFQKFRESFYKKPSRPYKKPNFSKKKNFRAKPKTPFTPFNYKEAICHKCGIKGHTAKYCRINKKLQELGLDDEVLSKIAPLMVESSDSESSMSGYSEPLQFDPEIERTVRRLRREHQELQAAVIIDEFQDLRNLNCREEIQPVNVHEGLNGQCVQRQPGNNNIIHMANDIDRAIRDYAVLTPQAIHPGIVRPDIQADNFELKPVMFQMLQIVGQFNGLPFKDPHLYLKLFLEVSDAFKIAGASQEALRLKLFPFSLRDRARAWSNSLPPDSITTCNDLAKKILMKYFPPTQNAKLRNEITSFH
ncbi:hypothetical protein KPL70_007262 [Citrus sinensis]|nr:hypothetical protein KPL70_007262 [Citrus sinensis]